MVVKNTNDGTQADPYLRLDINYGTCNVLPDFSSGPNGSDKAKHQAIKAAGFIGVQDGVPDLCQKLGLELTTHARINNKGELDTLIPEWKNNRCNCATIHLGWGMENDAEMDALVAYVLEMSDKNEFPIYIEIHRSTITQDMQRTVELVKRFPEIRFNGDFSHWYTGQEMVYGGIETKWDFIAPVFERIRFIHGRIGNPGSIQVDIGNGQDKIYVSHFKEMWIRSFEGFLKTAQPGDYICFTVELLQSDIFYARLIKNAAGQMEEEGDRWQQALLYAEFARECWEEAKRRININS